ncbi:MAG: methyl-accepting chemotaxis protein, partial [Magnetococcales bacterium]|nr:methyl-accepting chemotaxis protein [Magnetococcales bacterium]
MVALFSLEQAMMEDRQSRTRMLVEVAHGVMDHFYQKEKAGTLPRIDAQNAAKEAIKTLRYQEKDYFWINDMQPVMVMHPYKPELDGKNVSESKDPAGKFLFREFVRVVQEKGGGFVDYQWPKPGMDKPAPKISYVKGFQPWGWIIGSGIYVDDVETAFWQKARYDLSQLVVALIFMAVVSFLVMKSIKRTVTTITGVVDSMADGNLTMRVVVDNPYDEIQQIGARVNQLAESLEKTVRLVSLQSATVTVGVQRLGSVRESLLSESGKTTTTTSEAVQDTQKVVHASRDIRKAVEEATGSL